MIVFAINIHTGGGKVLLDQLLLDQKFGLISQAFCDERYQVPEHVSKALKIHKVKPTLFSRWNAEFKLKSVANKFQEEEVFYFGNLPPLLKLKNKAIVYVQNVFVVPKVKLPISNIKLKLRLRYEKLWFSLFWKNATEFWVQTEAMKRTLQTANVGPVSVKPFFPVFPEIRRRQTSTFDFIMVTSSSPQKRAEDYLQSLILLSERKLKIKALLITDRLTELQKNLLPKLCASSVELEILFNLNREEIFQKYSESRFLVNTSESESLCLPLYEAKHVGLEIITCDEDYATEAVGNATTFKTRDVIGLSNALERALQLQI